MASNYVREEFDCVVCCDQLSHPKFIGPCNHTFCEDCITKYWISLGRTRTIPCPQCREQCQIPPTGAYGLRGNFHLSTIIEKYQKEEDLRQDNEQQDRCHRVFKCFLCSEVALSFCKDCDANICLNCKGQHSRDPVTRHHDLFSLCLSHGKGLQLFCELCKVGVCGGCRLSVHAGSDHHVIPLRYAVEGIVSTISNMNIETLISSNNAKIERLEQHLQIIMSTNDVETERLELILGILQSKQMAIKTKFEQWQDATSSESILDVDCLASISQELKDLATVSKESDTNTKVKEVKKSIGDHPGHPRLRPPPRPPRPCPLPFSCIAGKFEKIKSLKKVRNVTFPTDCICQYVEKIVNLSDGCFAILGGLVSDSGCVDTVYTMNIYDNTSSTITSKIVKEVEPATGMAVISTGELVVTRAERPSIRIFHPDTCAHRDINIADGGEVIEKLWSVDTDDGDNMFVIACSTGSHFHLFAVNPIGNIIQSIQLDKNCRMAFSKVYRILYVVVDDRLLRFLWSQNTLKEISSYQHGVEGFYCKDVFIRPRGEVMVAGFLKNGDIMMYQVDRGGNDYVVWSRITFEDNVVRKSTQSFRALICCEGDMLCLWYNDKVEVFQMQYH